MNRIFQVSLRTIFEITFVVAVVLGFLYWRGQPRSASQGRYQLFVNTTEKQELVRTQLLFDTQTGETWQRYGDNSWTKYGSPPKQ